MEWWDGEWSVGTENEVVGRRREFRDGEWSGGTEKEV